MVVFLIQELKIRKTTLYGSVAKIPCTILLPALGALQKTDTGDF